jgi:hypothetical protein
MVRQAHHERNFFLAAHPELSRRTRSQRLSGEIIIKFVYAQPNTID